MAALPNIRKSWPDVPSVCSASASRAPQRRCARAPPQRCARCLPMRALCIDVAGRCRCSPNPFPEPPCACRAARPPFPSPTASRDIPSGLCGVYGRSFPSLPVLLPSLPVLLLSLPVLLPSPSALSGARCRGGPSPPSPSALCGGCRRGSPSLVVWLLSQPHPSLERSQSLSEPSIEWSSSSCSLPSAESVL